MKTYSFAFTLAAALATAGAAQAHVGVSIGKGAAVQGASDEVTFLIGHGCANSTLDTTRVEISIPAGVTSVRPRHAGVFGEPTLEYDAASPSTVTKVKWTKTTAALSADTSYYKFTIRMKFPATPWAKLSFRTYQVCKDAIPAQGGAAAQPAIVHDWGGSSDEPAPVVLLYPARFKGWNKYMIPHLDAADVPVFFNDAEIVWWNSAAYSSNPAIAELLASEPDVTPLEGSVIHEAEVWVKY